MSDKLETCPLPNCGAPMKLFSRNEEFEGALSVRCSGCRLIFDCCENAHSTAIRAWNLARTPTPEQAGEVVIDLEKECWKSLLEAAGKSEWMPPEYMVNDWISDTRQFLITGQGIGPSTPPAPELNKSAIDPANSTQGLAITAQPTADAVERASDLRSKLSAMGINLTDDARTAINQAFLALSTTMAGDYVMVPRKPTEAMLKAGESAANDKRWKWCGYGPRKEGEGLDGMWFYVRDAYAAMLSAASPTGGE